MRNGFWIEVEGPDGSGKGTQSRLLAEELSVDGREVVLTHEPWEEGPRGRLIRDILQHKVTELPVGTGGIDPTMFQWQYTYNRTAEHYPAVIKPVLERGAILVSDRGRTSTYAYGSAFGVSTEMIDEWHKLLLPRKPDMIIYLATAPKVCMSRLKNAAREGEPEYFERSDKIARIIKHYEIVLEKYFADITAMVDNHRSVSNVHQYIVDAVHLKMLMEER